jgi:hypothetical protein
MPQEASKGNVLAKQYLEKLRKEEVSIDWTHRVLISSIRELSPVIIVRYLRSASALHIIMES